VVAPPDAPAGRTAPADDADVLAEAGRSGREPCPVTSEDPGQVIALLMSVRTDVMERFVAALRPPQ
jgi:hypothetical protein